MLDNYKLTQTVAYKTLINAVKKNKFSHAYLFETHGYAKSLDLVLSFVKYILCPNNYSNNEKCENCSICKQIDENNHIELKIIKPDGLWIKKEEILQLKEKFKTKSVYNSKRIYIIEEAEKLNSSSANTLLKFLEEPEENIIAILMVENKYQLLDTIISRCQIISLLNNNIDNLNTTYEKVKNIINNENIDEEKLDKIVNFINYYEKNKLDTILNTNKLWHQYFTDKEIITDAFQIISLYYMDAINYSCGHKINIFDKYENNIKEIANRNNVNQLIDKINIVLELKDLIKYNINISLLMDKLILRLEEV